MVKTRRHKLTNMFPMWLKGTMKLAVRMIATTGAVLTLLGWKKMEAKQW